LKPLQTNTIILIENEAAAADFTGSNNGSHFELYYIGRMAAEDDAESKLLTRFSTA
jgi:hypothetical protein